MTPYELLVGDCREVLGALPEASVQCLVTSPPYFGLRDYGADGQIGLEPTPDAYVAELVEVFRGVRRVLRDDGTVWLNLGDSYANASAGARVTDSTGAKSGLRRDGRAEDSRLKSARLSIEHQSFEPVARDLTAAGLKPKDLVGIPWRVAFALQADGWYLRSDIIWHKPNPMPESVTDRPTKSHEYIFLLTKSERYHYDHAAIAVPSVGQQGAAAQFNQGNKASRLARALKSDPSGNEAPGAPRRVQPATSNKRTVWTVGTQPYPEAHFATYPPELIRPCILAGSREGDTVLDPFNGAGTTGLVALQMNRRYIGIELNPTYAQLTRDRLDPLAAQPGMFEEVAA